MIISRTAELDNTAVLGATGDSLRELFEHTLREAMQLEFDQHVGPGRYERNGERLDHRNGTRRRRLDTRMCTIDLDIPRLRGGAYMPSFVEHRTRSERAVIALVQEAVISGVSTRKLAHTESIGISPRELIAFIASCDREPLILDFDEFGDGVSS